MGEKVPKQEGMSKYVGKTTNSFLPSHQSTH